MKEFHEMLRRTTSCPYHDQMIRFTQPLKDHFGINHFWYYRILNSGHYTYLGTHSDWNEFCFENHLLGQFPILRHPDTQKNSISLMKQTTSDEYKIVQKIAWEKFQINFNLNISTKISGGIEAFGFATESNHPKMDEYILNELSLLSYFTKTFRENHKKLFQVIFDSQVNISTYLGPKFYQSEKKIPKTNQRELFLQKIGCIPTNKLTPREKSVLKLLSNGYPAPYIAKALCLSQRTVENYIATIKCKFYLSSKVELINMAKKMEAMQYF